MFSEELLAFSAGKKRFGGHRTWMHVAHIKQKQLKKALKNNAMLYKSVVWIHALTQSMAELCSFKQRDRVYLMLLQAGDHMTNVAFSCVLWFYLRLHRGPSGL